MARGKASESPQSQETRGFKRDDAASQHRARKRDLDRLAQRASRERAKSRTLYLEETLARLQADDKQKQISDLMGVIGDLRDQNTQLRTMLEKIGRMATSTAAENSALDQRICQITQSSELKTSPQSEVVVPLSPPLDDLMGLHPASSDSYLPSVPPNNDPVPQSLNADMETTIADLSFPDLAPDWWEEDSITVSVGSSTKETSLSLTTQPHQLGPDETTAYFNDAFFLGLPDLDPGAIFMPNGTPQNPNVTNPSLPVFASSPPKLSMPNLFPRPGSLKTGRTGSRIAADEDKWQVSDRALTYGIAISKDPKLTALSQDTDINSHEPFSAILYGSSASPLRKFRHPIWIAIREIDERVFGNWKSKPQKIAMMFVGHRLMLYRTNPCPDTLAGVPSFFKPRPSQERVQHPAVVDFLVWPGLRERLVWNHEHYTKDGCFSKAFVANLRFHWPFPEGDIFVWDEATGAHRISALFEQYACDIKNWTMAEEFFEQFAEMKDDIPMQGKQERAEKMFYDSNATEMDI